MTDTETATVNSGALTDAQKQATTALESAVRSKLGLAGKSWASMSDDEQGKYALAFAYGIAQNPDKFSPIQVAQANKRLGSGWPPAPEYTFTDALSDFGNEYYSQVAGLGSGFTSWTKWIVAGGIVFALIYFGPEIKKLAKPSE